MTEQDAKVVSRDDLDECWCCGGLHDTVRALCPDCDEAGCQHFGGQCLSDHKPVIQDGGMDDRDPWRSPNCGASLTVLSGSTARCDDCEAPLHRSQVEGADD